MRMRLMWVLLILLTLSGCYNYIDCYDVHTGTMRRVPAGQCYPADPEP